MRAFPDGVVHGVPLAPRTTLELGGEAEHFLEVHDADQAASAFRWARAAGMPVSCLGGGSNVLVPDLGIPGLVLQFRGAEAEVHADGRIRASAGTSWESLVDAAVAAGLAGVECLAGIPGSVGATPIQNVGAYGQEVSDTVAAVGCIDLADLSAIELPAGACEFAYRDSRFKRRPREYLVTHVSYRLAPGGAPTRDYRELQAATTLDATLEEVRDAVVRLRRNKSMVLTSEAEGDPNRRNAGSFFTNPIVTAEQAEEVVRRSGLDPAQVPRWPMADRVKLAAGWLIERAGLSKGMRVGNFGLSTRHALAIVHHGGGSCDELLAFAESIRRTVHAEFGVWLEREPRLLGPIG